jgi:hypothetical protein
MPVCDRCHKEVPEVQRLPRGTVGFYDVGPGTFWQKYARLDEKTVCDPCMWKDESFLSDFPHMRPATGP